MEDIKYKEVRRGSGRRSPGNRRVSSVGYTGPERRNGKDRRLATGLATAVVAGTILMGGIEEASAEVHGRRLTDKLHVQETVLPKRQYSLLNVPTSIKKFSPPHIKAVPSIADEAAEEAAPKALKTNYSTIYYDGINQLYSFSDRIEKRTPPETDAEVEAAKLEGKLKSGVKSFFRSFVRLFKNPLKADIDEPPPIIKKLQSMELTAERVDSLVNRVSMILHLDPPEFHVSIYLYDAYEELEAAYKELGHTGKAPKAFYSLKSKAVYIPVEGLSSAIFAHEIAHAVINSSYSEPLPHQLQEILAHHVYLNL